LRASSILTKQRKIGVLDAAATDVVECVAGVAGTGVTSNRVVAQLVTVIHTLLTLVDVIARVVASAVTREAAALKTANNVGAGHRTAPVVGQAFVGIHADWAALGVALKGERKEWYDSTLDRDQFLVMGLKIWSLFNPGFEPATF
jgi:hypothetical protein